VLRSELTFKFLSSSHYQLFDTSADKKEKTQTYEAFYMEDMFEKI